MNTVFKRRKKFISGWYRLPEFIRKASGIQSVSESGTWQMAENSFSRCYRVISNSGEEAWEHLYRTLRNEQVPFSFNRMGKNCYVTCYLSFPNRKPDQIEEEFDHRSLSWSALLDIFQIKIEKCSCEERIKKLFSTLYPGFVSKVTGETIWEMIAELECMDKMESYHPPVKKDQNMDLLVKGYFLRQNKSLITNNFISEIEALPANILTRFTFRPIKNSQVRRIIQSRYALLSLESWRRKDPLFYRLMKGEPVKDNLFTDVSLLIFQQDSPADVMFFEQELYKICKHYNQSIDSIPVIENGWNIMQLYSGTGSDSAYGRRYRTDDLDDMVVFP